MGGNTAARAMPHQEFLGGSSSTAGLVKMGRKYGHREMVLSSHWLLRAKAWDALC